MWNGGDFFCPLSEGPWTLRAKKMEHRIAPYWTSRGWIDCEEAAPGISPGGAGSTYTHTHGNILAQGLGHNDPSRGLWTASDGSSPSSSTLYGFGHSTPQWGSATSYPPGYSPSHYISPYMDYSSEMPDARTSRSAPLTQGRLEVVYGSTDGTQQRRNASYPGNHNRRIRNSYPETCGQRPNGIPTPPNDGFAPDYGMQQTEVGGACKSRTTFGG